MNIAVGDSKRLWLQATFTYVYYYIVMSPQEKYVLPRCTITDTTVQCIMKINDIIPFLASSNFLNEHNCIALCVPCLCIKECFIFTWYTNKCSFAYVGSSYKYRTALLHVSRWDVSFDCNHLVSDALLFKLKNHMS